MMSERNLPDKLVKEVSDQLYGEWQRLGIFLGTNINDLEKIGQGAKFDVSCAYRMLDLWWSRPPNGWCELRTAFEEANRQDLIEFTRCFFEDNPSPDDKTIHIFFFHDIAGKMARCWEEIGINLLIPFSARA